MHLLRHGVVHAQVNVPARRPANRRAAPRDVVGVRDFRALLQLELLRVPRHALVHRRRRRARLRGHLRPVGALGRRRLALGKDVVDRKRFHVETDDPVAIFDGLVEFHDDRRVVVQIMQALHFVVVADGEPSRVTRRHVRLRVHHRRGRNVVQDPVVVVLLVDRVLELLDVVRRQLDRRTQDLAELVQSHQQHVRRVLDPVPAQKFP
mmetsp:Transcript_12152/g.36623  ORF Transcript_12152/g.36623 Transcript_12152/m.36623 type:complete len:207 (-) Transcript_12152:297-917(-)